MKCNGHTRTHGRIRDFTSSFVKYTIRALAYSGRPYTSALTIIMPRSAWNSKQVSVWIYAPVQLTSSAHKRIFAIAYSFVYIITSRICIQPYDYVHDESNIASV